MITTDGPEKNTLQWSPDGINFEIMSVIPGAPHAIGLNRSADNDKEPTEILRWGLTHQYITYNYQCIMRFETWTNRLILQLVNQQSEIIAYEEKYLVCAFDYAGIAYSNAQPGFESFSMNNQLVKDLSGYNWKMKMMRPGEGESRDP